MSFTQTLLSIFLDQNEKREISPKDLTRHYRVELGEHIEDIKRNIDEVFICSDYSFLEAKIERYKFHSDRHMSTEFVDLLSNIVEVSEYYRQYDDWVITSISMHWTRYFSRRFDHIALLARGLSKKLGIPYVSLLSSSMTKHQTRLPRAQRLENKKNSFFIKNRYNHPLPKHIILIDDVISSGATLLEATKVLKSNGAEVVVWWCLASNN